ncbi:MAG: hypothetical protein [Bacteriophage sp.]|nr:MAG: hypothetical protein [Bacteriophage sp.]
MCFASKTKIPKPAPEQIKAPEPLLLEPPKGVELGDGADDDTTTDGDTSVKGRDSVTVKKTGEGTQSATSTDTGLTKKSSAVSKALKR